MGKEIDALFAHLRAKKEHIYMLVHSLKLLLDIYPKTGIYYHQQGRKARKVFSPFFLLWLDGRKEEGLPFTLDGRSRITLL